MKTLKPYERKLSRTVRGERRSNPPDLPNKVEAIDGVKEAKIELVWDPPWTPDRIQEEAMKRTTE